MKREDPGRDVSAWCPRLSVPVLAGGSMTASLLGVAGRCLGAEGRLAWAAFH